ncbi:MAG TPA: hypothetical protein VE226_00550 [Nitrososphaeraceae archaeon]|nr:hypothetical protein [Nitrososphaeraceae archaeon]
MFFLIINLISSGGHTDAWDGMVTFLLVESMATKHTAKLHPDILTIANSNPKDPAYTMAQWEVYYNKIVAGKNAVWGALEPVYSTRSLLLPSISVPFYYAALAISLPPILAIPLLVNSFIITLTSLVIFCFSLEIYSSKRIAFLLGLIFTVCSFILPYNTSLFPQPLQSLLIITAAYFVVKSLHFHSSFLCSYDIWQIDNQKKSLFFASLGGIFLGLSVFAQPTSIIVIPGFVVYSIFSMRHNKKSLISFLLTLSIVLFFMGLVNYIRFGSFTEFGYGSYFGTLSYNAYGGKTGLIGLLASPGKGLIFYFPVVILLPLALKYMYRQNRWLFFLIIYIVLVHWLYFGSLDDTESRFWSGAIAWGPRYLVPVLPFITLAFGTLLARFRQSRLLPKLSILTVCIAGFIVNIPGILVWSEYGTIYASDREGLSADPGSMEAVTWDPNHSPIISHIRALMDDYIHLISPEHWRYTGWHYITYGLAPCSYDLYIFCEFGIIPIVVLLAIDILLALKVMNNEAVAAASIRGFLQKIGLIKSP